MYDYGKNLMITGKDCGGDLVGRRNVLGSSLTASRLKTVRGFINRRRKWMRRGGLFVGVGAPMARLG